MQKMQWAFRSSHFLLRLSIEGKTPLWFTRIRHVSSSRTRTAAR
jgi:hypothetical protein